MAATRAKKKNGSRPVDGSRFDFLRSSVPHSFESLLRPVSVKLEPLDFLLNKLSSKDSSVINNADELWVDLLDLKSEIKTEFSGEERLTFEDAERIVDPFKDCANSEDKPEKGQLTNQAVSEDSWQQTQAHDRDEGPLVLIESEDSNLERPFCHVLKYRDKSEQPPHTRTRTHKTGKMKRKKQKTKDKQIDEHLCTLCGNTYASARNLQIHMRIHTGEKPYVCQTCGKAFTRTDRLASHTRVHTGQRKPAKPHKFPCSQCEKTFVLACYLRDHMRRHTKERLYGCHSCDKRFFAAGDRDKHVRLHLDLRPFVCTECGNSFAKRSTLEKHQRIHTGVRPYKCPKCGKALRYKYSLTMHMRTHGK